VSQSCAHRGGVHRSCPGRFVGHHLERSSNGVQQHDLLALLRHPGNGGTILGRRHDQHRSRDLCRAGGYPRHAVDGRHHPGRRERAGDGPGFADIGASAAANTSKGFGIDSQAVVQIEDCAANGNLSDGGFIIDWQDPETVDGVTITDCTSAGNGLAVGGAGFLVRHVDGPVAVTGSQSTGNAGEGLAIADTTGVVLVRDVTSTSNGGSGIETRIDGGPLTVADCRSSDNSEAGLDVDSPGAPITSVRIHRNIFADNLAESVGLVVLGGAGPFEAT